MKARVRTALLSATGLAALLLAALGCDSASVSGTVTYRERIALTPGAKLVVEIRDVSYADGAAPLIARQTISDPGQVPIKYKVQYDPDDIDSRNVYSVSARIIESDGRLAFTNDTAHEVITRGNPKKVDMVLVLVEPPPGSVEAGTDWRTWVETPAQVISANLMPNEREHFIRVLYYQSTIEGCARPGSQGLEVDGNDIRVHVTLMQPPPTPWSIPLRRAGRRAGRRGAGPGGARARADLPRDRERPRDRDVHSPGAEHWAHGHRRVADRDRRAGCVGRRAVRVLPARHLPPAQGQ